MYGVTRVCFLKGAACPHTFPQEMLKYQLLALVLLELNITEAKATTCNMREQSLL